MKINVKDLIKILSTISAIITGIGEIIRQTNIYYKKHNYHHKKS